VLHTKKCWFHGQSISSKLLTPLSPKPKATLGVTTLGPSLFASGHAESSDGVCWQGRRDCLQLCSYPAALRATSVFVAQHTWLDACASQSYSKSSSNTVFFFWQKFIKICPYELHGLFREAFALGVCSAGWKIIVNQGVSKKPLSRCDPKKMFSESSCPHSCHLSHLKVLEVFALDLDHVCKTNLCMKFCHKKMSWYLDKQVVVNSRPRRSHVCHRCGPADRKVILYHRCKRQSCAVLSHPLCNQVDIYLV
jgi:hypothetical protein